MSARSLSPRAVRGSVFLALIVGAATSGAQQAALRPGQSPGPRFIMPTLMSDAGGRLGFQVANAVRERIASDVDIRTLWVVPESTITKYLIDAGYPADQPLSTTETRQLAASFRADELLNGVVSRTPTGTYRVQMAWSLAPREDMVQPLPTVEAAKISDVAKLVSREFLAARRQVEFVQRCVNLARARNYAGALIEARKAIDVYPQSVLGRVCIANIYDQQKLGADSMIRISEEILAIHPENARALAFAADAYAARGRTTDRIRVLRRLVSVEPANTTARSALVQALVADGKADSAVALVDSIAARDPANVELGRLQWLVHLSIRDWAGALAMGPRLIALDSTLATPEYFMRMIAAADAAGLAKQALDLATAAAARYPANDELAIVRAQLLRRDGQTRAAHDVLRTVVQRNPRAPNAWTLKARLELELGEPAESVLASLEHALGNQYEPAVVAATARGIGQTAARDTTAPNKVEPLRAALRYLEFSNVMQANDTTTLLIGTTNATLASRLANEPSIAKRCEAAKELATAVVNAQVALPKVGRVFPDAVGRTMQLVMQLAPYSDQVSKSACRTKDDQDGESTP